MIIIQVLAAVVGLVLFALVVYGVGWAIQKIPPDAEILLLPLFLVPLMFMFLYGVAGELLSYLGF